MGLIFIKKISGDSALIESHFSKHWYIVLFILNTFLFLASESYGQELENLVPYRLKNKWGYADSTGKLVIKPRYQDAEFFEILDMDFPALNGVEQETDNWGKQYVRIFAGAVKKKGKWGLIDTLEKILVPMVYDSLSSQIYSYKFNTNTFDGPLGLRRINHGLGGNIAVKKAGKWGLYKIGKEEIVPCLFKTPLEALNQESKFLALKAGKSGSEPEVVKNEKEEIPGWLTRFKHQDKWFLPGTAKEILLPLNFNNEVDYTWTYKGVLEAKYQGKWGLIDTTGKVKIPFIYDSLALSGNRYTGYNVKARQKGLWGILSLEGKTILPIQYEFITGEADGNIINPDDAYEEALTFSVGQEYSGWVNMKGEWHLLNKRGQRQSLKAYDAISKKVCFRQHNSCCDDGLPEVCFTKVNLNGKYGVVEQNRFKEIVPAVFDTVLISYAINDTICDTDKTGITFLVGKSGKFGLWFKPYTCLDAVEILPCAFDSLKRAVPYRVGTYDSARFINKGFRIWGKQNGNWNLYNENGTALLPEGVKNPVYINLNTPDEYLAFHNRELYGTDYLTIKLNGKWGLVQSEGKMRLPFVYDSITGFGHVFVKVGETWQTMYKTYNEKTGEFGAPFRMIKVYPYENLSLLASRVGSFNGFKALTEKGWILLDTEGKRLTPEHYEAIDTLQIYPDYFRVLYSMDSDKYINLPNWVVKSKGKYGLINEKGVEVLPIVFKKIEPLPDYYLSEFVKVYEKRRHGYINLRTGTRYFKNGFL